MPAFTLTLKKVVELTDASFQEFEGDVDAELNGFCSADNPKVGALGYVENIKRAGDAISQCGAIICKAEHVADLPSAPVKLVHKSPQTAFATVLRSAYPSCSGNRALAGEKHTNPSEKFPGAYVSDSAAIEADVHLSPGVVIGSDVQIGAGTSIAPNTVIGDGSSIGRNCQIGASCAIQCSHIGDNVIIHSSVQIGQDGFGYYAGPAGLEKVPQIGRVIIQDGVEIGANSTIDRGALDDTTIGQGTKIDNLVQIGHNVQVGCNVVLCAHVGLSGSCVIGDGAMLGGSAGIADHIHVGAGAQVAAAAGVMTDIPPGERWGGAPAQPLRSFFREQATLRRLSKPNKQ